MTTRLPYKVRISKDKNCSPALSLVLWLAISLAVFVEPLSRFAPGGSVGGSVLGATVECLTLVPEHGEEGHLVSQGRYSHWNGNWQVFHFTVLQGRSPGALTIRSTSRPRERTTRLEVNRGENQPILVATNDYSESCSGQRRMGEGCQRETEPTSSAIGSRPQMEWTQGCS